MVEAVLAARRVLVTAGPTYEDIDPVRYLANRSSGKMGFAIAEAAAVAGAEVTLIAGPSHCRTSATSLRRVDVRSAREMLDAVMAVIKDIDIFIACAAVADYRPAQAASEKIKKTGAVMELRLVRNADILATVAALPDAPFTVGFAAETCDLESHAKCKLESKGINMIAANCVAGGLGFDNCENELLLLFADGHRLQLEQQSKRDLAQALIAVVGSELARYQQQQA